jgi:hypothetical protein
MTDLPNYRKLAEELNKRALWLVGQVLIKHTAAILKAVHEDMQQTSDVAPVQPASAAVAVPQEFIDKVFAANRATHPIARDTLIAEAVELLAAAPEAKGASDGI